MGLIFFMGAITLIAMIGVSIAVYINRKVMFPKRYQKQSSVA